MDITLLSANAIVARTHWAHEILSMLHRGKAETISERFTLLEATTEQEFASAPSPRVLTSHLPLRLLPDNAISKIKIVLVLRNPKDLVVSKYHHMLGMRSYDYTGAFKHFLQWFLEDKLPYGSWFQYVREMEAIMDTEPDRICMVHYEDLKQNGIEQIKKIAQFLSVDADDQFCQAIYDCCSFENMAVKKLPPKDLQDKIWKPGCSFYRKGIIGDWKTHFTVAESEMFDEILAQRMTGSKLKFRFSDRS
ncbi:sulfotransferase 1A3-like isoform X2 [Dreissena polymorpha]|uniref:sulfotransferase 1A3-like isoform X2 n=1 Tax=Dreissena polymorpha TaxID=45954 RepID=UPI00226526A5|nr:sulfotransferase 1A3-like isoform X2 [Dreissena polymorpha]